MFGSMKRKRELDGAGRRDGETEEEQNRKKEAKRLLRGEKDEVLSVTTSQGVSVNSRSKTARSPQSQVRLGPYEEEDDDNGSSKVTRGSREDGHDDEDNMAMATQRSIPDTEEDFGISTQRTAEEDYGMSTQRTFEDDFGTSTQRTEEEDFATSTQRTVDDDRGTQTQEHTAEEDDDDEDNDIYRHGTQNDEMDDHPVAKKPQLKALQALLDDDDDEVEAVLKKKKKKKLKEKFDASSMADGTTPSEKTTGAAEEGVKKPKPPQYLELGTREFLNDQRRKWIEPVEAGEGYHVLISSKSTSPIVKDLADARQVVEWFRRIGYVGVREREDGMGFDAFVIMDGALVWIDNMFETADDAARAHDEHVKANRLPYIKNFRAARGNKEDATEFARFNRNADLLYYPGTNKGEYIRTNIRFTRNLAIRLAQDPKVHSAEIWRALKAMVTLCTWWGVSALIPMRIIRDFSEALRVALRLGDRQLCKESIAVLLPVDGREEHDAEFKEALKRKLLADRLRWADGVFEQFQHMYMNLRHRRYPRQSLIAMRWGSEILRLQASLLIQMDNESRTELFGEQLEQMEHHPLWKHHSDFLCLRGEYLLSRREDTTQMRQAQRLFARALRADPHNARALMFLTASEHVIHEVQSKMRGDQMMSISQRTTQDLVEDEDDEDGVDADKGDENTSAAVVAVTKQINAAIRDHPKSVVSWLALEGLLFVESGETDTKEVREKKRVCLVRLIELQPTLSGHVLQRIDKLWALTRTRSKERKVDFFWAVAIVAESLTQKECPTYVGYFSNQSVPIWEYLVTCLNCLPAGTITFDEKRTKLWLRRFFPDTLGFFQDPFSFYKDRLVVTSAQRRFMTKDKHHPYHYILALKAVVASMAGLSEPFHVETVKYLGTSFVHEGCIQRAMENCYKRADRAVV